MISTRKLTAFILLGAAGLGVGYVMGFIVDAAGVAMNSSFVRHTETGTGFAGVYSGMTRLKILDTSLEMNIAEMKKGNAPRDFKTLWAMQVEQQRVIQHISENSKAIGLRPQLDVARAINSERAVQLAELEGDQGKAERYRAEVQSQLIVAGWTDPTEQSLRKYLAPLEK